MNTRSAKTGSDIRLKQRARVIVSRLRRLYPQSNVALTHTNPLELLIATILSAQCTDVRVNIVTKDLFKKYRTVQDYAKASQRELEKDVHSTGFYRSKAKNIINCCKMLLSEFGGNVPDSMEELTKLAGVGRKTANVVLSNYFGIHAGIVVDTHVKRLAFRLGLTAKTNPEQVERDLTAIIPQKDWMSISNMLILHGRKVCPARKPKCAECSLNDVCPSAELNIAVK